MITKKTKLVGLGSLVFLVVACVVLFAMWRYVETKGAELLEHTKEIANHQARQQTYNELEQLIDSTKDDRDELSTYVLTEDKTIDFLATVEQIAIEQGIAMTTNALEVVEQDGLFDTLIISFSVEGPTERVYSMVHIFETLPYHAFVSGISFLHDQTSLSPATKGTIELTVSLLQYDR
jgi:hypothetical protein